MFLLSLDVGLRGRSPCFPVVRECQQVRPAVGRVGLPPDQPVPLKLVQYPDDAGLIRADRLGQRGLGAYRFLAQRRAATWRAATWRAATRRPRTG